ncbi:MAG: HAD family phosphatase [Hymenobacter sp.]|nr:HAD family phosphatase [Hymenobacter sp.]
MKAFIFDLNGTMIHDMDYHTRAWQHLLNHELGGHFSWDEIKPQMYGKNQEVLERLFGVGRFTEEEMQDLSLKKEKQYQREFRPHLRLLPGLPEFLAKAHQRAIPLAIGSAAIPFNIDFVLDTLGIRHYFHTIVSADDVVRSKPHPETFLQAAARLRIAPPDCLFFEDVPKGAEAAQNAGMNAVVLTTTHTAPEFAHLPNVLHCAADFTDEFMDKLLE